MPISLSDVAARPRSSNQIFLNHGRVHNAACKSSCRSPISDGDVPQTDGLDGAADTRRTFLHKGGQPRLMPVIGPMEMLNGCVRELNCTSCCIAPLEGRKRQLLVWGWDSRSILNLVMDPESNGSVVNCPALKSNQALFLPDTLADFEPIAVCPGEIVGERYIVEGLSRAGV